jgi:hypothetical protein
MKQIYLFAAGIFIVINVNSQVSFNVSSYNFGSTSAGTTLMQPFTLTSNIIQNVTLTGLSVPFSVLPESNNFTIANSSVTIDVFFHPTSAANFTDTLIATGSIWGTQTLIITGTSTMVSISTGTSSLNFGTISVGVPVTQALTVTNEGTGNLVISNITSPASNIGFNPTAFTLGTGQSIYVTVTITPVATGSYTDSIHIYSNDPVHPVYGLIASFTSVSNVSGNVYGTWFTVNSPYYIIGNITVPHGQTLTIQPGCRVIFKYPYNNTHFDVEGTLIANGTQQDSIIISGGGDIDFDGCDNPPQINYCRIGENILFYDDFADGQWQDSWTGYCSGYSSINTYEYSPFSGLKSLQLNSNQSNVTVESGTFEVTDPILFVSFYIYYNCNSGLLNFYWKKNNSDWRQLGNWSGQIYDWNYQSFNLTDSISIGDNVSFKFATNLYNPGYGGISAYFTAFLAGGLTGSLHSNNIPLVIQNTNLFRYKIYSHSSSSTYPGPITLINCKDKNCDYDGITAFNQYSPITLTNSLIQYCKGIVVVGAGQNSIIIENSQLKNNYSVVITSFTSITMSNSNISYNNGAGIQISSLSSINITNSEISYNNGNGICIGQGGYSINIYKTVISHNNQYGIYINSSSIITIHYSKILCNTSTGLYCESNSGGSISLQNSLIAYNGQGIYCQNQLSLNYVTIKNNLSYGLETYGSYGSVDNSIIWNNDFDYHHQLKNCSSFLISYSNIQGKDSYGIEGVMPMWGDGNINSNPIFTDSLGHLAVNSPSVDAAAYWEQDAHIPYGMGGIRADQGAYGGPDNDEWGGSSIPDGKPVINNIVDIPGDQGGHVGIQWQASIFDFGNTAYDITDYSIWRALNVGNNSKKKSNVHSNLHPDFNLNNFKTGTDYWEFAGEMESQGFQSYGFTAETIADSTSTGIFWNKYVVIAHTPDNNIFFISEPDSGYSVDNLAPPAPSLLSLQIENNQTQLIWFPSIVEDFNHYAIYKTSISNNYLSEPYVVLTDTIFIDGLNTTNNNFYYIVKAVDNNGNISSSSNEVQAFPTPDNQLIILPQGWSMFSTYISPISNLISSVFSSLISYVAIVKDENGLVYWPEYNVNQIGNLTTGKGYLIKMLELKTLYIYGIMLNPDLTPISLSLGWSMIGYLRQNPAPIDVMLTSIISNIIIVKDSEGNAYWPYFNVNLIGNMLPGKGYQIKTNSSCTLLYPSNSTSYQITETSANETIHFSRHVNTGNNMTLGISCQSFIDNNHHGTYEIAAFDPNQNMVGSGILRYDFSVITLWGDDELTPEKDGLTEGEKFNLFIWNNDSGEELPVTVGSWIEGDGTYMTNGISIAENMKLNTIEQKYEKICLFQNAPNPFRQTTDFKFTIPELTFIELAIYDISGKLVEKLISNEIPAGEYSFMYTANNITAGVYYIKLKACGQILSKEICFIK